MPDVSIRRSFTAPQAFLTLFLGACLFGFVASQSWLAGHSTMTALQYDATSGRLTTLQETSTLPAGYGGRSSTAEVRVSADGRFVYGSNRGHDSIAVFRVESDGKLTLIQIESIVGKTPRNFILDLSGRFLLAAGQSARLRERRVRRSCPSSSVLW